MNKHFLAVLLAGLASANAWPADAGARAPAAQAVQKEGRPLILDQPYSAMHTLTARRQRPDGGEFFNETVTKLYRDSEGRMRRDMLDSDGQPLHSLITDTDGSVIVLNHRNRTISTGSASQHPPARRGPNADVAQVTMAREAAVPAPAAAPVVRQLGEREMEGVTATGKVTKWRIGKGAAAPEMTTESWISKELGLTLYVKNVDAKGESVIAISDLDRSEPDPALFAAPGDYQRKP